jgi:O-antigen/teichoic acid export membrane protein
VPPLVLCAVMASVANYFSYGIQIAEKNQYRMWLNLGALPVTVMLNLLLVPRLGVLGAAFANAVCFMLLASASLAVSQRLYPVPYSWSRVLPAVALGIAVSHAVIYWNVPASPASFAAKTVIAAATIGLAALLLRLPLQPQTWRRAAGFP